jgi:hypothetical protein
VVAVAWEVLVKRELADVDFGNSTEQSQPALRDGVFSVLVKFGLCFGVCGAENRSELDEEFDGARIAALLGGELACFVDLCAYKCR